MNGFKFDFSKNFPGRGSPSPLPRPLPPLFLGLRPRFGLRPQFSCASRPRLELRPRYSGASRPRFVHLVQNTLARVVTEKSRFCHITPVLSELHWLPVRHRINFKIATITFKVLQFQQPSYLATLIPRYVPTQSLRSSFSLSLCIPTRKTEMAVQIILICCLECLE